MKRIIFLNIFLFIFSIFIAQDKEKLFKCKEFELKYSTDLWEIVPYDKAELRLDAEQNSNQSFIPSIIIKIDNEKTIENSIKKI